MVYMKRGLCVFMLLILFMAGGCGGGGGSGGDGDSSQSSEINGTWEIVSGHGIVSNDESGRIVVAHYTYAQGRNSEVGIEMTQNTSSTYYGMYEGLYTTKLSGDNVIGSGGLGALIVYCTIDETKQSTYMNFPGGMSFSYDGNGTYHLTGNSANANSYEYTLTLEDESTLRWVVWNKKNAQVWDSSGEYRYEIVLNRTGTSNNNNNGNGSNGNTNNNVGQPVKISGKWEISSGYGTILKDNSTMNLTYKPGSVGEIEVKVTQNDSGEYEGFYSVNLSGRNLTEGALYVECTVDGTQNATQRIVFPAMKTFEYIGNGTYQCTEKNPTGGINVNADTFTYTLKLEGSDTLRWTQQLRKYDEETESTTDIRFEIVLKKAR